jgi:hypothetical protein
MRLIDLAWLARKANHWIPTQLHTTQVFCQWTNKQGCIDCKSTEHDPIVKLSNCTPTAWLD